MLTLKRHRSHALAIHLALDTFSFQARGFYDMVGCEEFGRLDYPPTTTRHFLHKRLTPRE